MTRKQAARLEYIKIGWKCSCGKKMEDDKPCMRTVGGCSGGHQNEYCYCPSMEVRADLRCSCGVVSDLKIDLW